MTNPSATPPPARSQAGWLKRTLFATIAVVMGLSLLEGLCSFGWLLRDYVRFREELPVAVRFREEFHTQHDPEIGWVNVPETRIEDIYGPGRSITINADGYRGLDDVGEKAPGQFRLLCLGDSFTLGYGVDDRDTYPAQLEAIDPDVQVVNMGQGGYSLGQCYLWYLRDCDRLEVDGIVLAFILDDIWRMGEGRLANGAAAPGFELHDGALRVTGQPLPPPIPTGKPIVDERKRVRFLIDHNAIMRSVDAVAGTMPQIELYTSQEKFQVALRIIAELQAESTARNVPLLVMLLPELREITDSRDAETYHAAADVLRVFTADHGLPFLDLHDAFAQSDPVDSNYLQEHWHHYSERGNRLVARQLHDFLTENLPGYAASADNSTATRDRSGDDDR